MSDNASDSESARVPVRSRSEGPYPVTAAACLVLALACIGMIIGAACGFWSLEWMSHDESVPPVVLAIIAAVLLLLRSKVRMRTVVTIGGGGVTISAGDGPVEIDLRLVDAVMHVVHRDPDDEDEEDFLILVSSHERTIWWARGSKFGLTPRLGRWLADELQRDHPAAACMVEEDNILAAIREGRRTLDGYALRRAFVPARWPTNSEPQMLVLPLDEV